MNYKPSLLNAIQSLDPSASATVVDNKDIIWDGVPSSFTREEIDAEYQRLLVQWELLEYQRLRAVEYPSIQQQLDMQYWDSVNGTTTWQDAINAVKTKYPKPE